MCHDLQGKIFKQLWRSAIRKKPSQTCAHFHLILLLCPTNYSNLFKVVWKIVFGRQDRGPPITHKLPNDLEKHVTIA